MTRILNYACLRSYISVFLGMLLWIAPFRRMPLFPVFVSVVMLLCFALLSCMLLFRASVFQVMHIWFALVKVHDLISLFCFPGHESGVFHSGFPNQVSHISRHASALSGKTGFFACALTVRHSVDRPDKKACIPLCRMQTHLKKQRVGFEPTHRIPA